MTVESASREARTLHPLLSSTFAALDEHEIRWCLLRGEDDLEAAGEDVDVLVAAPDFDRASGVLARLGFARLPAWGHGSHAFFLAYHAKSDRWIWLDVVTDVRFGRYQSVRVGAETELLAGRERRDGLTVVAPKDAFWMLLLHCLLDKDGVPGKHRARLEELADEARDEGPLPRVLAAAGPSGWSASGVREAVEAADWAGLDALGRRLRSELTDSRWGAAALRALGNRWLRAANSVRRRLRCGLIVAVLAPDGAGKSTLAAALRTSFPSYDVRVVYMGLYGDARRGINLPGLYLGSRLALAWGRYLTARFHRAAGRLVVLDRYVYDVLLPPRRPIGRLQRAHRWLVSHSLPAPDLALVLDVPGTTAFARKAENDPGSLERERRTYLELSAQLPGARVVDASADPETVRRRAVSVIWSACLRRLDRS